MTREEQIKAEAKKYYSDDIIAYDAFLHGIEFAEKLSSWISVEDDLPYKHKELILNKEHPFLTNKGQIKTEVRVHIAFMIKDIIKVK